MLVNENNDKCLLFYKLSFWNLLFYVFFMDMFFLSGRNAKMKLLKKQKNCDYLRNISHFRLKLIEYTGFVPLVSMAHQKFRILEQIGRKESFSFFSSKVVYMRGNQILWVVMWSILHYATYQTSKSSFFTKLSKLWEI